MSFNSTKNTLDKLLEQVDEGNLQLPEFQRNYVWAEEAVVRRAIAPVVARSLNLGRFG